ncbi:unnamed protein product, partial [Meganyctiphanes norvegica]
MSNYKSDCRKFQPNIFNKSKCTTCFRAREEHSAEALESNRIRGDRRRSKTICMMWSPRGGQPKEAASRGSSPTCSSVGSTPGSSPNSSRTRKSTKQPPASRKVSKCGYLFVAPDWDFSVPLNRTKRWQRRWFVLYDDGELTYSVDDHPATIPQGVINMTRVQEVAEAEDVTGNQYSLAITAPERITFVKGTCKEESRWWLDVLSVFPRAHKAGRHKRNATFPGIKSTTILKQSMVSRPATTTLAPTTFESPLGGRVRFHSCTTDPVGGNSNSNNLSRPPSAPVTSAAPLDCDEDVFPTKDPSTSTTTPTSLPTPIYHSTPLSSLPASTRMNKENTPPYLEDYTDNPPTSESPPTQDKLSHKLRSRRAVKREARGLTQPRSGGVSRQLLMTDLEETKREEKLKDIADSITRLRGSSYRVSKSGHGDVKPTRECDPQDEVDASIDSNKSTNLDTPDTLNSHNIRGDPDGCVLETGPVYTTNPDLQRVDLPAEDLLYIKKGWLMKQTLNQEWNKYWFVLRGTGLMFYRDPSAEDNGILDGIIDLSIVKSVEEYEVQRNYGFTVMTWEEKKYVFSAVTSGIRANWVQALRNAANLKEDKNRPLSLGEKIEREISAKRDRHNSQGSNIESFTAERDKGNDFINESGLSVNTSRYIISSDDEYRTASEPSTGSQSINNTEDYFEWERVRSRSNSRNRIGKRSKSSPPTSRRGTRDDFPIISKGEIINPCFSETGSVHSINDLDDAHPEKDSSATTLTGTGDALLVDLLETQVESLKAKLEQTQADYLNLHKENSGLKTRLKVSGISIPFKSSPSGKYQDQDILHFQSSDVNLLEQSPTSLSPAKLELKLSEAREAIASLTGDLARLRKKIQVCEGDLERSESEVEKLRRDKEGAANEAEDLRRRVASLEMQIKELLDRVEEQEHDLVEKTACANQLNEMRKKYNELLQRVSSQRHSPDKVDWKQHYEDLEKRFLLEREEWEERLSSQGLRLVEANASNTAHKDEAVRKMARSLKEAEQRISKLVAELEEERSTRRTKRKDTDLDKQVEQLSVDLSKMRDNLKSEKSEVYKWKDLVKELRSLLDGKNDDIERKREEIDNLRETLKNTQKELDHTADRLHRGIEENESLCTRIREMERQAQFHDKIRQSSSTLSISSSRERFSSKKNLPRMDSLSDLTNVNLLVEPRELDKEQLAEEYSELGMRFEKAVNEIRALKREIRESQNQHDDLDLLNVQLKQDLKTQEDDFISQHNLLTDRVQDLSNKLSASEKQVRLLKQKLSRTESRDRRRTLSLKGKESFALSRDMEQKLSQLEAKVESLLQEGSAEVAQIDVKDPVTGETTLKMPKRSRSFDESTKSSRLRRKSLDSPVNSDAMKTIVRLNTLEAKMGCINGEEKISTSSASSTKSNSRPKSPTHPASPLRSPLRSPSMQRKNIRSPRATPEKTVKLNRSDSESKILRERLSGLEKVLTTLQTQLTECVAWAGSVECVCSCGAPGISSLKQSLSGAVRITQLRHSLKDQSAATRVRPMAVRMQDMLREKLTDLYNRRDHLKNCGKWTRDSQLKLFAERLSYETLVLTQVAQVMQAVHRPDSYQSSVKLQELIEAHRKLSFLEKKLTNPDFDMDTMSPLDFYTSLLAEKLVVQGELAGNLSTSVSASQRLTDNPPQLSQTCLDLQKRLLDRERSLANLVTNYKEGKLHEIAIVMARETISGTSPPHDDSILLEEVRMREAWSIAQDLLTQDLVNTEATQSLMRLCELLTPAKSSDSVSSQINNMTASTMERWQTAAEESLRQEMEEAVFTLSNKYEEVLAQYRAGDTAIVNSVTIPMEGLLAEFAAVVAQKAMIDGQLAVVQNENESVSSASEPLAIVEETRDNLGAASDVVASEAHLLMFLGGCDSSMENLVQPALDQSEFTFLYNKMGVAVNSDLTKLVLQAASQARVEVLPLTKSLQRPSIEEKTKDDETSYTSLPSPTKSLSSPKIRRKSETRKYRRASDITGMADGCRQCEEMRQEIAKLKRSLDTKRAKEREAECKQCVEYINKLKALEQDHRIALSALNAQHGQDMLRLREQKISLEPPTRDSDDELTELKRRLCLLEEGYEAQIDALKKQYEEALEAAGSHPDLCDENIRQRYQVEITQLRGLCEKGLGAMENSHKRMLAELEEKHRREMAALQAEKEQALAEETQATLAALDAMRKAHEAEVQREIAKFKEEFIRKMQSGHDIGAIHKEHEAEMEDIRTEILSLSEKYSIKCLESAALEEKLDAVNKQLTDANKQIFDLEARNKHLKTHLSAKVSQGQEDTHRDSSSQLRLRESELVLCNEEISRLNQQLQQTKSHEADLGELCRQLGHFLKAERQLRTDEVSSLREKLEHIILTAATMQDQNSEVTTENGNSKDKSPFRRGSSLNSSNSKDLIRSPSCPRLSGFSSFLSVGPTQGGITGPASTTDLPSPLAGMVASRKKVFETTPVKATVDNL